MAELFQHTDDGERCELHTPTELPRAGAFLWNRRMMIQVNCRGYATAQFMQPEPASYVHPPVLAAKTFMQPEQGYFAHHPGRFFYVKDEDSGLVFSAPYEPVRRKLDGFVFSVGKSDVQWRIECDGIRVELSLSLPVDDAVELWNVSVRNVSQRERHISVYAYFPVGYASWMNQSGEYRADLGGVVCSSVTPYQKVEDHFKNKLFKDRTFLLSDPPATSWEVNQETFEGEGGLSAPSALALPELGRGDARFEIPACVLQYRLHLLPAQEPTRIRLLFGPAFDDEEIRSVRRRYFVEAGFSKALGEYARYVRSGEGCLRIETPDAELDNFVNHWLSRQVFYHGDVNRLTTDPQTRNYLQDSMGMSYIRPELTRQAFILALSQQKASGAMPDGILLPGATELKYINQIPHTDHCVWLPVCLGPYLDETNDYALLDERVPFADAPETATVFEHISRAMRWLLGARDARGLSYIAQGDWCDPMNMVGYKGKGVSGWLSLASAYALNLWADVCETRQESRLARELRDGAQEINRAVNTHLWDGAWFGRGITDDGAVFGVSTDPEGSIFLNPQGWSLLSGAADERQRRLMLAAVDERLETPYGVMLNAPAFTKMRDDIGRVTQKHPGSAENGSVYNHAGAFYAYGLYQVGENDRAYNVLRRMIPGPEGQDVKQRGQLPVFIPNYYRGAYREIPRTAGRSSQLFNTGTVSWFYRSLVDGLFGLRGSRDGLLVQPQLPSAWSRAKVRRRFRGADFVVEMRREPGLQTRQVRVDGRALAGPRIDDVVAGRQYEVEVVLPISGS